MNWNITVTIPRVDIHVHHADPALLAKLDGLAAQLAALRQQGVSMSTQIEGLITRFNDATNEIAKDLKDLRDQIANGTATPEQLAKLEELAGKLEALGADPANPVPTVEG